MKTLDMVRDDIAKARLLEAQGRLVNTDPIDIDFECPLCGQELASVMVNLNERVVVTTLGEDHDCFEPMRFDLDELFVSDNPIARAAVDAIGVYYRLHEDIDTLLTP